MPEIKLFSINSIAVQLGIDRRTVRARLKDYPPRNRTKNLIEYDLKTIVAAFAQGQTKAGNDDDLDLTQARARLATAQAEKTELELAVRRGELIDLNAAALQWAQVGETIKSKLMAIPSRATPVITGQPSAIVFAALEKLIYECLTELAGTPPGTH